MTISDTRAARRAYLLSEIPCLKVVDQDDSYQWTDFTCLYEDYLIHFRVCGLDGNFYIVEV